VRCHEGKVQAVFLLIPDDHGPKIGASVGKGKARGAITIAVALQVCVPWTSTRTNPMGIRDEAPGSSD
jgi:hypothetical protein